MHKPYTNAIINNAMHMKIWNAIEVVLHYSTELTQQLRLPSQ